MSIPRSALSVDDVWERLATVKDFVKSRRQIDLSKRDIEFLLEYRERMDARSKELERKSNELECIRRILKRYEADCNEESLAELAQYQPVNETELVTQAHRSMVLLKGFRIAIKDCLNKTKAGAKLVIPRDYNIVPAFYSIIKENMKKKEAIFDKEVERMTKLNLWINQQTDKPARSKKASTSHERGRERTTKTASTDHTPREPVTKSDSGSIPPTPAPTKSQNTQSAMNSNLSYTCHLLLNTHPAASKVAALKKIPSLEEKLRYLLDDLGALQEMVPPSIKVTKLTKTMPAPDKPIIPQGEAVPPPAAALQRKNSVSKAAQTDSESSIEEISVETKSSSSQTLEDGDHPAAQTGNYMSNSRDLSHQNSVDSVFLSNSMSQKVLGDQLQNIKEEHHNADQIPHKLCHQCKHVFINDNISMISEETHTDWDDFLHSSLGSTTITAGKVNRRMSHDLESLRDHNDNHLGDYHINGQILTAAEVEDLVAMKEHYAKALEQQNGAAGAQVEMHSRAVSARSAGFTPAKRQTVRLKNSTTQTEEVVDIESADPEQLFSEDIADGPLRQSYSDYQQAENEFAAFGRGRQLLSPDSEAIIMWTVSNNLNHGQWQKLFTKLMNKTEEIIPPQEIKEEISSISEGHTGDKTQAMAALELWRQTNGKFETNVLLETLEEIRRKDIVNLIRKYISRQHRLC